MFDRPRFRCPRTCHRVLLVGAGVGITPLCALAEGLDHEPGDATVLCRYSREPLFAQEFVALADSLTVADSDATAAYLQGAGATAGWQRCWVIQPGQGADHVHDIEVPDAANRRHAGKLSARTPRSASNRPHASGPADPGVSVIGQQTPPNRAGNLSRRCGRAGPAAR